MPDGAGGSPASKSGSQKSGGIMRQGMREISALKGRVCLVPPIGSPGQPNVNAEGQCRGALKLTAWWLCEDGMISDEGHGGQVASVCRAVAHARERERERERGSRRQRARVGRGEQRAESAEGEGRLSSRAAQSEFGAQRQQSSKAAKQQSSSLRRRGLDIP